MTTTIITKTCTKCGIEKSTDKFSKHKTTKDRLNSWCKECSNESTKLCNRKHAKKYETIIKNRWTNLNLRCVNGIYANAPSVKYTSQIKYYHNKGITLNMTKDEFVAWMYLMKPVHESIIAKGEKSSIDRIDENKGYSIDNIQMISLHENIEKRVGKTCHKGTVEEKARHSKNKKDMYRRNKANNQLDNEI